MCALHLPPAEREKEVSASDQQQQQQRPDSQPPPGQTIGRADKQRVALRCRVRAPASLGGEMTCYVTHLDAFAGRTSRVQQFGPVLNDARARVAKRRERVAIGGDLNTHNHGVARLLPMLTGDDHFIARAVRGDMPWSRWREWNASEVGRVIHSIAAVGWFGGTAVELSYASYARVWFEWKWFFFSRHHVADLTGRARARAHGTPPQERGHCPDGISAASVALSPRLERHASRVSSLAPSWRLCCRRSGRLDHPDNPTPPGDDGVATGDHCDASAAAHRYAVSVARPAPFASFFYARRRGGKTTSSRALVLWTRSARTTRRTIRGSRSGACVRACSNITAEVLTVGPSRTNESQVCR